MEATEAVEAVEALGAGGSGDGEGSSLRENQSQSHSKV